jgi:hypothetical protein
MCVFLLYYIMLHYYMYNTFYTAMNRVLYFSLKDRFICYVYSLFLNVVYYNL